jgi:hypothetical protein
MVYAETGKLNIFLWDKGDGIESLVVANIRKLSTRVVHFSEALPSLGTL